MKKQVILLNGPSSAGKSTLSNTLQALIAARMKAHYSIVSIDDFMKLATSETIYEDDVFEISGDMCEQVLADLKVCSGTIIDHVITSPRIFEQLKQALGDHTLKLIHVTCPLEVLLERERMRGNRCLGSAKDSYTYLYPKEGYDLTVYTHSATSEECADSIVNLLSMDHTDC